MMFIKNFRVKTLGVLTGFLLMFTSGHVVQAKKSHLAIDGPFPIVNFPVPSSSEACDYLGVDPSAETFTLPQIKASVVVLEIFSVYCPHCKAEAPNVNDLIEKVESAGLGDKIKFLGVGANNSEFEVAAYQKKYEVTFPLLPDPDLYLYHALGDKVGTPFFVAVKLNRKGDTEIFYSQAGPLPKADVFFEKIKDHIVLQ
jgi:peroxiredoxin